MILEISISGNEPNQEPASRIRHPRLAETEPAIEIEVGSRRPQLRPGPNMEPEPAELLELIHRH
ncbi:MAG: hypothetical protein MZV63_59385 [Marinilabiliales bacterium]|nr:hypothetical protein [Marinilabiliales bacterium]